MPISEWTSFLLVTVVLAGAGTACLLMRLRALAGRRVNSAALVQSVTVTSPIYREALEALGDASGRWSEPDALSRTLLSSDPVERVSAERLQYLFEFFEAIAVGIRERALDETVVKAMLEKDLRILYSVAHACIERFDALEPLRWLTNRWVVQTV